MVYWSYKFLVSNPMHTRSYKNRAQPSNCIGCAFRRGFSQPETPLCYVTTSKSSSCAM